MTRPSPATPDLALPCQWCHVRAVWKKLTLAYPWKCGPPGGSQSRHIRTQLKTSGNGDGPAQPSIRCSTITTATIIGGTLHRPVPVNRSANISSGEKPETLPVHDPVNRVRGHPPLTEHRRATEQVSLPWCQTQRHRPLREKSCIYANSPAMINEPGEPPHAKNTSYVAPGTPLRSGTDTPRNSPAQSRARLLAAVARPRTPSHRGYFRSGR